MIEDIKPVVAEKKEFEYQDVSITMENFRKFETVRIMTQGAKPHFFDGVLWWFYKVSAGRNS